MPTDTLPLNGTAATLARGLAALAREMALCELTPGPPPWLRAEAVEIDRQVCAESVDRVARRWPKVTARRFFPERRSGNVTREAILAAIRASAAAARAW